MTTTNRTALVDAVPLAIPSALFGILYGATAVATGSTPWLASFSAAAVFGASAWVAALARHSRRRRLPIGAGTLLFVTWSGGALLGAFFGNGLGDMRAVAAEAAPNLSLLAVLAPIGGYATGRRAAAGAAVFSLALIPFVASGLAAALVIAVVLATQLAVLEPRGR